MRRTKRLEAVAYHEAGHVVMCWCGHIGVKGASIVPDGETAGNVTHDRAFKKSDRPDITITSALADRMERLARVCLAGTIAQRRYNPRSLRRHHAEADWSIAADLALRLGGSGEIASAYVNLWDVQTKQALETWWPVVEAVAADLLDKRELSRDEVEGTIEAPVDAMVPTSR